MALLTGSSGGGARVGANATCWYNAAHARHGTTTWFDLLAHTSLVKIQSCIACRWWWACPLFQPQYKSARLGPRS